MRYHKLHATYIEAEVSGVKKWVETYHLHNALRQLFGMPNVRLSLSELKGQDRLEQREAIEWIPCNYVMLNRYPRATIEEQKRNIFKRCHEYRDLVFPEPNQIIRIGDKLLVELSKAVLHFSQKEVEEYRKRKAEEKAKREQARGKLTGKIALSEEVGARILNTESDSGTVSEAKR